MAATKNASVVIPVFNGSKYIVEAVESALAQEGAEVEIIVVNDGSTDEGATQRAIEPFLASICYIDKSNGGVASALNEGIQTMRSDWFSWLSYDDRYRPDKIRTQLEFASQTACRAVFSDYALIDVSGKQLAPNRRSLYVSNVNLIKQIISAYPINGCTTLLHRSVFDTVGLFDEAFPTANDYDMWFRISTKYDFRFFDHVVADYRIHPLQGSRETAPERTHELETVYARMLAETVAADGHYGLSEYDFEECISSLAVRRWWSAASVGCRGAKSPIRRLRLYMKYVLTKRVFLLLRYSLNRLRNALFRWRDIGERRRSSALGE